MTITNAGLQTTTATAIPLRQVEVVSTVYGGHAQVTVRQRYRNAEPNAVEAVYVFPLPADASLVGFAMVCDGRRIEGIVKEREEAFRQYDDAITAGHGAALLEQERPNVFTASVGNLLPGEETLIEVQYLQRLQADEGALRWMIPTLVAPRYIPGTPAGDRTADGWAEPTDRVPDADRITPRLGPVDYGLTVDLLFDLGSAITVESPSHQIHVTQEEGKRVRVSFASPEVALDRDVVLIARGVTADAPLTTVVLHRPADTADNPEPGVLALTVVPDLAPKSGQPTPQDVVFLIDISGSMMGASIGEAQAALRLCLRHLREGDRFNIIVFQSTYTWFARQLVPFTQRTLDQADAWVQGFVADGGTELLEPLLEAVQQVPDGVVVLLTDGQVGNEEETLSRVLQARRQARVYAFGIGTNVSDTLLRDLAKRTGGAVEFIHPGERIDEKAVAQFARAVAARVTDVTLSFSGDLEVSEQAPSELPALVDGEPWEIFARVTGRGQGRAEIRGKFDNEPFCLTVPIDWPSAPSRPVLVKFWAAERIRDFEALALSGRRAERMKERIVALAVRHGLASRYTSFLVIEHRTGARRAPGQRETRVIPVNLPAGWAMFDRQRAVMAPRAFLAMAAPVPESRWETDRVLRQTSATLFGALMRQRKAKVIEKKPGDPLLSLLSQQLASGLWDEPGAGSDEDIHQVHATARALLELLRASVTTAHPLHGAQVKKAIEALVKLAVKLVARDAQAAELALGVAWLAAVGRRLRDEIERIVASNASLATLQPHLGDEQAVRAYVEQVAV